jgi:GDP-D-mannose dehydratase
VINHNLRLVVNDLTDAASCFRVIEAAQPQAIYNLGGQSFDGIREFQDLLQPSVSNGSGPMALAAANDAACLPKSAVFAPRR